MKVVIANPPWPVENGYGCRTNSRWPHIRKDKHLAFPIYLAYSAAILEKNNIEVKVIDAVADELDNRSYVKAVEKQNPDICFIETSTPTINIDLESTKLLKENLDTRVFMMGAHATVFHREILQKNTFIDGIIRGEFEFTIRDIAIGRPLREIRGLTFRKNKEIIINPERPYEKNLDSLPFPAWHQFTLKYYDSFLNESPSMMMISSRGCPFQCTYCLWPDLMYGHIQRRRSPGNVCDEIGVLIERYGIREIKFDDDTFALNKKWVMDVCREIINRGYHREIVWNCFGHVSQGDPEMYRMMAKAGCKMISYGIESGSQKILDIMRKNIDMKKAKETISNAKKAGIDVYCDYMIGFPEETEEDIEKSIESALYLDPDFIQVSYTIPYPGTRMYKDALQKGILLYPNEWEKYCSCGPMIKNYVTPERMMYLYKKFWKRFYMRPRYMIKTAVRMMKSTQEFRRGAKGFVSFYKRFLRN
ncbi:MAG TPA: radical SAM protein [Candidatus Aenigmarchaeota archaeon]|nr:radical SAM protein [Candidatus Aenigmarchaeota archaeon]